MGKGGHSECEGVGRGGCIHRQRGGHERGRRSGGSGANNTTTRPSLLERAAAAGLAARGRGGDSAPDAPSPEIVTPAGAEVRRYGFSRPPGQVWTEEELEAGRAFEDEDEENAWYAKGEAGAARIAAERQKMRDGAEALAEAIYQHMGHDPYGQYMREYYFAPDAKARTLAIMRLGGMVVGRGEWSTGATEVMVDAMLNHRDEQIAEDIAESVGERAFMYLARGPEDEHRADQLAQMQGWGDEWGQAVAAMRHYREHEDDSYSQAQYRCSCGWFKSPDAACRNPIHSNGDGVRDAAREQPSATELVDAGELSRVDSDVAEAMSGWQFGGSGYYEHEDDDDDENSWRKPLSDEEAARLAERHLASVSPEQRARLRAAVQEMVKNHHAAQRQGHMIAQLEGEEQERGEEQADKDLSDEDELRYTAATIPKDAAEKWYFDNQERLAGYGFDREITLRKLELDRYPHLAEDWQEDTEGRGRVHLGWATARAASTTRGAAYDEEWHSRWQDEGEPRMRERAEESAIEMAAAAPGGNVDEAEAKEWAKWEQEYVRGTLPAEIREEVRESFRTAFRERFEAERDEVVAQKTKELREEAREKAQSRTSYDAKYGVPDSDSDTIHDLWETGDRNYWLGQAGYNDEQIDEMFQAFDQSYRDSYDERFKQEIAATAAQAELDAEVEAASWVERRHSDDADAVAEDAWRESRYANELHGDGLARTHDTYTATFADRFRELGGEDEDEYEDEGEDEGDAEDW